MWSSRLFWKLFLSYAGLNLLSAAAFVLIVTGRYEDRLATHRPRPGETAAVDSNASEIAAEEEVSSMRRRIWAVAGAVSLATLALTW